MTERRCIRRFLWMVVNARSTAGSLNSETEAKGASSQKKIVARLTVTRGTRRDSARTERLGGK